jgi:hypothetical protein
MSSKRALKLIMLLPLIGMLLSCDVFLTPKLGRWNTKDPNAELEPYNRILKPKEDTWVDPSMKDISSLELRVKYNKYILLKFDIPALPDIITVAELQLYCITAGNGDVSLHRILQPWEAKTLDPAKVRAPEFFDPDPLTKTYIGPNTSRYYSWDVKDSVGSLTYGILLMEAEDKESKFYSVEVTGSEQPMLVIEGYNKL